MTHEGTEVLIAARLLGMLTSSIDFYKLTLHCQETREHVIPSLGYFLLISGSGANKRMYGLQSCAQLSHQRCTLRQNYHDGQQFPVSHMTTFVNSMLSQAVGFYPSVGGAFCI